MKKKLIIDDPINNISYTVEFYIDFCEEIRLTSIVNNNCPKEEDMIITIQKGKQSKDFYKTMLYLVAIVSDHVKALPYGFKTERI